MRTILALVMLLQGVAYAANSGFRIFTSLDGRSTEAKIIGVDLRRGEIEVMLSNEQCVKVKPDIFSEKDQEYIKAWIAASSVLSEDNLIISVDQLDESAEQSQYSIELRNLSGNVMENLIVEYRIYVNELGYNGRDDAVRCTGGRMSVGSIPVNEAKSLQTDMEALSEQYADVTYFSEETDAEGNSYTGSHVDRKKLRVDEPAGIWVRVYGPELEGSMVFRDVHEPRSLASSVTWKEDAPACSSSIEIKPLVYKETSNWFIAEGIRYLQGDRCIPDHKQAEDMFDEALSVHGGNTHKDDVAINIGKIYFQRNEMEKAEEWTQRGRSRGLNALAWYYATTQNKAHRNGQKAVEFAKEALKKNEWVEYLDTLACAYARNNQFELAVETAEEALKQANRDGKKGPYARHLELFRQGKAWPPN